MEDSIKLLKEFVSAIDKFNVEQKRREPYVKIIEKYNVNELHELVEELDKFKNIDRGFLRIKLNHLINYAEWKDFTKNANGGEGETSRFFD